MTRFARSLSGFALLLAPVLMAASATAQQGEWQGPFTVAPKWGPFLDVGGMVGTQRRSGGAAVGMADGAGNLTIRNNTLIVTQSGANGALGLSGFTGQSNTLINGNTITVTGSGAATSGSIGFTNGTTCP